MVPDYNRGVLDFFINTKNHYFIVSTIANITIFKTQANDTTSFSTVGVVNQTNFQRITMFVDNNGTVYITGYYVSFLCSIRFSAVV